VDITYSGELRYGKTYMTARLWHQAKTDFLLYAGTWKDGSTFSLARAHQSITSTTLIFDKCHVRCYRPRVSCIEGIIDFERGSIRNCQLRRLLHDETSSAIFVQNGEVFTRNSVYKYVPFFSTARYRYMSLTLVRLLILKSLISILNN